MSRTVLQSRLATIAQGLLILWLTIGPVLGPTPGSMTATPLAAPISGTESEEEERTGEVRSAVEWVAPLRADRRSVNTAAPFFADAPIPVDSRISPLMAFLRPTAADPFANGLGAHYRC